MKDQQLFSDEFKDYLEEEVFPDIFPMAEEKFSKVSDVVKKVRKPAVRVEVCLSHDDNGGIVISTVNFSGCTVLR